MYRARIYYGKLDALSEDGLEGEDHYRVVLWPGDPTPPVVLKAAAVRRGRITKRCNGPATRQAFC